MISAQSVARKAWSSENKTIWSFVAEKDVPRFKDWFNSKQPLNSVACDSKTLCAIHCNSLSFCFLFEQDNVHKMCTLYTT